MIRPIIVKSYGIITIPPFELIVYLLKHPEKELYTVKNHSYFTRIGSSGSFNTIDTNDFSVDEWGIYEEDVLVRDLGHFTHLQDAEKAFLEAIKFEKNLKLQAWDWVNSEIKLFNNLP
ncbi:hypothetical protein RIF25_14115 [Thermosynechococcaceae cyanobacterium BACA0444]|uniref:Uncharacterized protein n=1 Tax=Pseudocalidococcus azoricus BACA0444 TaxID=2918990 RepID=A0AAE4FVQ6_9CYAN|nr:hypothetical protein [Pseudocalidococcus azoricus]MDS3861936.1 hypothetical protein [Pseudocalidococcus azoricus BACA0444]